MARKTRHKYFMDYNIVPFSKVTDREGYFKKVLEWCDRISKEDEKPAAYNMRIDNWENEKDTLAHILWNKTRFDGRGEYFFLEYRGRIIAGSGIYRSDFHNQVAIGGVRAFINKEFRSQFLLARHVLPAQLAWATPKDYKAILLTFNDYNKNMIKMFTKTGLGVKKNRTPDMLFYNGVHVIDYPILIKNVPQWAIYHKIDESFDFNWQTIKAADK